MCLVVANETTNTNCFGKYKKALPLMLISYRDFPAVSTLLQGYGNEDTREWTCMRAHTRSINCHTTSKLILLGWRVSKDLCTVS